MKFFLIGFIVLLMSGCVTTTDSIFTRKENKDRARDNYIQLGLAYIQRNDFERARSNIKRALEIDSGSSEGNAAFGLLYQQEAENVLAEEHFKKALNLDESNSRGRTFYGAFLFNQGRYEEALAQFRTAGSDTGYNGRAYVYINIAQCELKLGRIDEAVKAYEKSLILDRYQTQALIGVTQLLVQQGGYDKALRYFNRMINVINSKGINHSPTSLWLGIELARYYNNDSQETAFAAKLEELYPESAEYQQYRALTSND